MKPDSPRWVEVTQSQFPWEREALSFIRDGLPDYEPYRAWANFEFLADDGSVNEVDLLVLSPRGFFLVEIKSRPGEVAGDAATWIWTHEGRTYTIDNPLLLANRKAKKLASLLRRQKALRDTPLPFLEPCIFLSAENTVCRLDAFLRQSVQLRDREGTPDKPGRPGILQQLTRWPKDEQTRPRVAINRPLAAALTLAMGDAGIRASQKARRVGDYRLEKLLLDGPGYQDWEARHVSLEKQVRRVRIYTVATAASADAREMLIRAARREAQILEGIEHPGILKAVGYTEHSLGPALIFEHDPQAVRLDHFLQERGAALTAEKRVRLMRQIGEAVEYAHKHRLVHRALSPQCILVSDPDTLFPRLRIFNWQTAARTASSPGASSLTSATSHIDQLIEDKSAVYMAPEALAERGTSAEQVDVFSLGAITYHVFSGRPPATSFYELVEKLREGKGLQISAVLDGVVEDLDLLIQYSTYPEVTGRWESASDFLKGLDDVEVALTEPRTDEGITDPLEARPGDHLAHDLLLKKRLGRGASAVALLVEREGKEMVLKLALDPEQNDRLKDEAEVLTTLRHQSIVEIDEQLWFGDRVGLLMARAGATTLAQRLREEGRLHLDLLERFGEEILATVDWLDQKGVAHRDIKPENIGVEDTGKGLHIVLFDFSLSRTPPENIRAGTVPYLDPFLSLRKPATWDTHAERFAAAVTLYQMATGSLPTWGDGRSDPAVLDSEARIDSDLIDPSVREGLTRFFERALRRNFRQRFDNAQEMLHAWRQVFTARPETKAVPAEESEKPVDLDGVTPATQVALIGLGTRALNALERLNVVTVSDLLHVPIQSMLRMRGVGNKTRKEIVGLFKELTRRFPDVERLPAEPPTPEASDDPIDRVFAQLLPARAGRGKSEQEALRFFLGVESQVESAWPSQSDVAQARSVTRARVGQWASAWRKRWIKLAPLQTIRDEVVMILDDHGGVMTSAELADALLLRRGSSQQEPLRSRQSGAVLRAATESEASTGTSRWVTRRVHDRTGVLIARDEVDEHGDPLIDGQKLLDYAERLGREADRLASADPLPSPARVLEALREISRPGTTPLPQSRLLQLAASVSRAAAASSRGELYPRGMPADRALRLAMGALAGTKELTIDQLRERVEARYPHAQRLPARPELDRLLQEVGGDFVWHEEAANGRGAYVSRVRDFTTVSSLTSLAPAPPPTPRFQELTPEETEARLFEKRLRRAEEEGTFLTLTVSPRRLFMAEEELASEFDLAKCSFDALLIRHMREVVTENRAEWSVVLRADAAARDSRDWSNLMHVVRRSLPRVKEELERSRKTLLLTSLGLLARYDQLAFIDELREAAGRRGGPHGVWLLVPADAQDDHPVMDGKPVPVTSPIQWARIPDAWLDRKRAVATEAAS